MYFVYYLNWIPKCILTQTNIWAYVSHMHFKALDKNIKLHAKIMM